MTKTKTDTIETRMERIETRIDQKMIPGDLLREYIGEANHQGVPWEGFTRKMMEPVALFLEDLFLYQDNYIPSSRDHLKDQEGVLIKYLEEGNSKSDLAIMVLEKLTPDEIQGILVYIKETERALSN